MFAVADVSSYSIYEFVELEFGTGVRERSFQIRILYDGEPELRESFSVSAATILYNSGTRSSIAKLKD